MHSLWKRFGSRKSHSTEVSSSPSLKVPLTKGERVGVGGKKSKGKAIWKVKTTAVARREDNSEIFGRLRLPRNRSDESRKKRGGCIQLQVSTLFPEPSFWGGGLGKNRKNWTRITTLSAEAPEGGQRNRHNGEGKSPPAGES